MKISTSKTEVMKISREPGTLEIYVDDFKLKQVSEFKCLGSIFTADGRLDREIETRRQKANPVSYQLSPLLKHSNIDMTIKLQMIKCIFQPVLCYQCQTWSISRRQANKITTCEMNVTRRDRIRNTYIRKTLFNTLQSTYRTTDEMVWPTQNGAQPATTWSLQ
jgi:hypothetical protein